ncbi:hypothetical protein SAMN04487950_3569 [Halogranum rubrum]|uniref:DUF8001 domain-containing protein n=1 Tax=Halogranum rubrum TaxID=553466 RepID=A0A1I4H818_9EURY|nr:hypothetical protein [Halogranum rubrum]SFL38452.1 hypothetical protein SAMN04487950_3569 [Halogranum rubrum]
MPEPLHAKAGELSADEILDALREGRRVVIETEMLGGVHKVTLRIDGDVYYCDTPTTLHRHPDEEGMRTCIDRMGYGRRDE